MAAFIPFHDWLLKNKTQRTPVGELAREVLKDQAFPKDVTTLDAFLDYVRGSANTSTALVSKARIAWKAFERGR